VTEPVVVRPLSGDPIAAPPSGLVPARSPLVGRYVRLDLLDPATHADDLYAVAQGGEAATRIWDYMSVGPFASPDPFRAWLRNAAAAFDTVAYAIVDGRTGKPAGMCSYLNIVPRNGSIEIGSIWFAPSLQRTREATEAMYLLMRYAMDDLRYRRLEWKCNALNQASRRAALRLGFRHEGIFHRHMIVKGRNRDTAWYSIVDDEWPAVRRVLESWLSPENFDAAGRAKTSLSETMARR
jgi:RimJ/RimL family protein N-acetyltransferase